MRKKELHFYLRTIAALDCADGALQYFSLNYFGKRNWIRHGKDSAQIIFIHLQCFMFSYPLNMHEATNDPFDLVL